MRPSYEDLEEQVAYLKSELGLQDRAEALQRLRLAMKLAGVSFGRMGVARLILALYAAGGRPMTRYQLLDAIPSPGDKDDRDASLISVWVSNARKGFGPGLIANAWGNGYYLTAEGIERVALMIGDDRGKASIGEVQDLNERPSEVLRNIAAHIAGILAHRDADGGRQAATIYRRIADRLAGAPRRAA